MILIVSLYCEFSKLEKGVVGVFFFLGSPPKNKCWSHSHVRGGLDRRREPWLPFSRPDCFMTFLIGDHFKSLAQKTACSTLAEKAFRNWGGIWWRANRGLKWFLHASRDALKWCCYTHYLCFAQVFAPLPLYLILLTFLLLLQNHPVSLKEHLLPLVVLSWFLSETQLSVSLAENPK